MDVGDDNAEENRRYSFLLGCALRSEDSDQFFKVYDAVLPKDTPEEQLLSIKEEARKIAELSEAEFSQLAVNARDYSLAKPATMTDKGAMSLNELKNDFKFIDEDDETPDISPLSSKPKPTLKSVSRTSRHFSSITSDSSGDKTDANDSGVFSTTHNSSRGTISVSSPSDIGSDGEGSRPGMFHYLHKASFVNKQPITTSSTGPQIERSNNKAYDEAYTVGSESEVSSTEVSPRDAYNEGTEMKTFKISSAQSGNMQYTKKSGYNEEDDRIDDIKVHERLYRDHGSSFTRMQDEDEFFEEDYTNRKTNHTFHFPNSLPNSGGRIIPSRPAEVDSRINLFEQRSYGSIPVSSSSVKVEKTVHTKSPDSPPFGRRLEIGKVGKSVDRLLDKTHIPESTSEPDGKTGQIDDGDGKKKKKKKKVATKDDAGSDSSETSKREKSQSYDVNGNPELPRTRLNPRLQTKGDIKRTQHGRISQTYAENYYKSNFPQSLNQLGELSHTEFQEEMHGSTNDHIFQLKKMRKQAKKEKNKGITAGEIPGHQGDKQVDELLEFIENTPGNKKKKTSSTLPAPQQHQINNAHNLQNHSKNKKNNKDKKHKSLINSSVIKDEKSSSDTGSDYGDDSYKAKESHELRNEITQKENITSYDIDRECDNTPEVASDTGKCVVEMDTALEAHDSIYHANDTEKHNDSASPPDLKPEDNTFSDVSIVSDDSKPKEEEYGSLAHYIFTDIDQPPREEKFQVVGKKKKKPITKETLSHEWMPRRDVKREDRRRPVRSATPPPVPVSSVSGDRLEDRSLSPSAFPALSTGKEGRRNSTGNVVSVVSPPLDDSDLESVKSLPSVTDKALSPGAIKPVVSYAKIAASPKPSPSSSRPMVSERRHSFSETSKGSKEKELKKDDTISKSQEELSITDNDNITNRKARRKLSGDFNIVPTASPPKKTFNKSANDSKDSQEKDSAKDDVIDKPLESKPQIKAGFVASSQVKVETSNKPDQPKTNANEHRLGKPAPKKTKSKTSSSVIFLDKRMANNPSHLDISFVFEDSEVPDVIEKPPNELLSPEPDIIKSTTRTEISFGTERGDVPLARSYQLQGYNSPGKAVTPGINGLIQTNAQGVIAANTPGMVSQAGEVSISNIPDQTVAVDQQVQELVQGKMAWPHPQKMYENENVGNFKPEEAAAFLLREWDRCVGKDRFNKEIKAATYSEDW